MDDFNFNDDDEENKEIEEKSKKFPGLALKNTAPVKLQGEIKIKLSDEEDKPSKK